MYPRRTARAVAPGRWHGFCSSHGWLAGCELARRLGGHMAGFRKILIPIDFSTHSSRALQIGIDLAKTFGAKLHLLHCYQINVGAISPYGLVIPERFDRDIREA